MIRNGFGIGRGGTFLSGIMDTNDPWGEGQFEVEEMKANFVKEEKDLGNAVEDLKTEQPEWRYVETPLTAEVEAGDIRLRPHWKGAMDASAIREVVRKAAAAPALYEAVKELIGVEYRHGSPAKRKAEFLAAIEQGRAALALVDGPQTKEGGSR